MPSIAAWLRRMPSKWSSTRRSCAIRPLITERLTALDGLSLHAETKAMLTHAGGLLPRGSRISIRDKFHTPLAHLTTSNIPGPAQEIHCAGGHVDGMFATPPLYERANLNIAAASHGVVFDVTVTACPDNVKDVESVARGMTDVVAELLG
jgi:hypothetical protein